MIFLTRWPQITVPSFKLISSQCLQKVRIGEQICLVRFDLSKTKCFQLLYTSYTLPTEVLDYLEGRMKFSWPLSTREAIIHYFEFEYLRDDLVVVLLNSVGF